MVLAHKTKQKMLEQPAMTSNILAAFLLLCTAWDIS